MMTALHFNAFFFDHFTHNINAILCLLPPSNQELTASSIRIQNQTGRSLFCQFFTNIIRSRPRQRQGVVMPDMLGEGVNYKFLAGNQKQSQNDDMVNMVFHPKAGVRHQRGIYPISISGYDNREGCDYP